MKKNRIWLLTNYNINPSPFLSELDEQYLIINKGEKSCLSSISINKSKIIQLENSGHNLSDYLYYIIENYKNLPDSIGFAKGNLVPRHISLENFRLRRELDGFVSLYGDLKTFKPKFKLFNKFGLVAQQIGPGYYSEITNNWYIKSRPSGKYFPRLEDFFNNFFYRPPPKYITFIPGGCMVVPAQNILSWSKETYQKLFEVVTYDYFPVEAFHLERSMLYFFCYPKE